MLRRLAAFWRPAVLTRLAAFGRPAVTRGWAAAGGWAMVGLVLLAGSVSTVANLDEVLSSGRTRAAPATAGAPMASVGASATGTASSPAGGTTPTTRGGGPAPRASRSGVGSEPVRLTIASIGVDAQISPIGLTTAGELDVPPLQAADQAGWYRLGPAPGQPGNAVIVGHVDSYAMGPAVFFRLHTIAPGDSIVVHRLDGGAVRFTVDSVRSFAKAAFPSALVYGSVGAVGLRLVTCGGRFDRARRTYLDNTVVFASPSTPPPPSHPPR